ncbi:hypothetical protein ACFV4H_07980, partial [Streptomyces cellulosae]
MKIDWAALGSVFGVSLVVTVALVALFTLGISGLSRRERASAEGRSAALAGPGASAGCAAGGAAGGYGLALSLA